MTRFLLICLGGAIGTGARYLIVVWAARTTGTGFPYGTLLVNLAGSFLIGVLMQLSLSTPLLGADARLIVGTGILGGFTTYSAFNHETLVLLRDGSLRVAAVNVTVTLLGCLGAGALGTALGRTMSR